jgi:NADH-quinone oxidoreductase subunit C
VTSEDTLALIQSRFEVAATGTWPALGVTIARDRWVELARTAKDDLGCRFFAFSTAIDWKDEGLDVVARLENLDAGFNLTIRTRLPKDDLVCPSLVSLYRGANWMEREIFDMFGIQFDGHPDLRRILLPDDWHGHPLLKSYDVDTPYPPYR